MYLRAQRFLTFVLCFRVFQATLSEKYGIFLAFWNAQKFTPGSDAPFLAPAQSRQDGVGPRALSRK